MQILEEAGMKKKFKVICTGEEVHLIYQEIKRSYTQTDLMGKTKGKTEANWKAEQN